jgi:uncharacterized membrane protein
MEFLGDQGRDLIIVSDFLKKGDLFFIGPQTSVGNMYLGPYFYYLIAPSLLFSNFNPIGPAIMMALFGIATVWLLYYVSKHWFNDKIAIISSFLYAISPITIKYSNFSWNPNIMPFFALLFFYSVGEAIIHKKYKYLLLASISFIFCINSHYLALLLLPSAGLFWLIHLIYLIKSKNSKIKNYLSNTLIAFAIFVISLTPQILFDIKHHGQNINNLISFFSNRETTVSIKPYKAIPEILPIFNQISVNLITGKDNNSTIYISLIVLLFACYLTYLSFKKIKNCKSQFFLLSLTWLSCGLVGLGLYKQHLYNHYFGFLFPVIYIILGYILAYLFSQKIVYKILSLLVIGFISFVSIKSNALFLTPNYQISHAYNIAESIYKNTNESDGKYNLVLLASYNDFRAYAPRYYLSGFFNSPNLLSTEQYQEPHTLYVILDDPSRWPQGINSDLWELNIFGNKKITSEFYSKDNVKIIKVVKDNNETKAAK